MLPRLAQKRLSELRAVRAGEQGQSLADMSAVEAVHFLKPKLDEPHHLAPYGEKLDEAPGAGIKLALAAPPQHGKTTLASAGGFVKWMADPRGRMNYAYATYSQKRSDAGAREARELAEIAGLEPRGTTREWRVNTGARVLFTSIGGGFTGSPVDGVLVVDDPLKDREEANSARYRERAWHWLTEVGDSRLHPGASMILMATRWHPDDPTGRAVKELGWEYINLKAVCDDPASDPLGRELGEALWEERRPLDFLKPKMANAFSWASLWQGEPRPRGAALFNEPTYYDWPGNVPREGFRVGYGVDLAYTRKTHADWSVCLQGRKVGELLYLTDCHRKQVDAPSFTLTLKAAHTKLRGRMRWYASGTEIGSGDFIKAKGIPLDVIPATSDKFVRAQAAAEAWNDGRILVPSGPDVPDWVHILVDEVCGFTGVDDPHDDIVDALAALWDMLETGVSKPTSDKKFGKRVIPQLSRWDR